MDLKFEEDIKSKKNNFKYFLETFFFLKQNHKNRKQQLVKKFRSFFISYIYIQRERIMSTNVF